MVQIEGTYVHEKSEGLEAYLGAIGVPWVARKAAANTSPTIQISKEGEEWSLAFKTAIMSNVVKFVLGEEFEEKAPITGEINKVCNFCLFRLQSLVCRGWQGWRGRTW